MFLLTGWSVRAQLENKPQTAPKTKKDWSKVSLTNRAADHLMMQFGYAGWSSRPDTINTQGFSRTFNMYLLFDFPFKSNPRLSVAIGAGVGTDNIFFENTTIDLINERQARFTRDTITDYKKYKLQTGYAEIPLELRFSTKPENMNSGFKAAIGVKVGTLLDAKTKAKVDQDALGRGGYLYKEKDKQFFNSTRLVGTIRIGWGNISAFGTYTITDFFKEGDGPTVKPYSIGLCLSGL
jgi:hypothetical protein